jgi:hypothetical protein
LYQVQLVSVESRIASKQEVTDYVSKYSLSRLAAADFQALEGVKIKKKGCWPKHRFERLQPAIGETFKSKLLLLNKEELEQLEVAFQKMKEILIYSLSKE